MNFEEFVNRIKESIRDYLPREYENAEVLVQEQQKLNNRYTGLLVLREGGTMTPTLIWSSYLIIIMLIRK